MRESKWSVRAVRKSANWRIPSWGRIAYLIINGVFIGKLAELVQIAPDKHFDKVVAKHLSEYVDKGVMPPDEIAPAILNMADDLLAGSEITIRAGDYIALQNFLRGSK